MRARHKYGAKRATSLTTGRSYASTAERDRAEELRMLALGGAIADLVEQPRIHLVAGIHWRLDFAYREIGFGLIYEDVKGFETETFRLKCRLWAAFGPAPLRILKREGRSRAFVVTKTIMPDPAARTAA